MKSISHGILIVTLLAVVTACGSESFEQHMAKAQDFIAAADSKAATIELKNALQKDGKSARARWLLGKIYLDASDVVSAEKELRRALDLGWDRNDVVPALARSLSAQGKHSEILKLDATALDKEAESTLLALKSMASLSQRENASARKLADKALQMAPESTDALLASALTFYEQGEMRAAKIDLDILISLDPNNGTAWSLLGDIHLGQQRPDEALAAYNKAVNLQQNSYGARYKRAILYMQMANYEAAQADADALLKTAPGHPGANYVDGLLHYQAQRYPQAIAALSVAEPAAKQLPMAIFFLGSAELALENREKAASYAARFHKIMPGSVRGRKLLATIQLHQNAFRDVEKLMRPVLDAYPDDVDTINLMANALLGAGKTNEGISLLSRAAELRPNSATAQIRLGAGLLMGGETDAATVHVETALKLDPKYHQADILLVLNHLQRQDYDAAITAAQSYKSRNPTSATALNLLGRVYQSAGMPDKAQESYEKALAFDAGDPSANHNLAQLAAQREDISAARQYYATILASHPNNLGALVQLAILDAKENDRDGLVRNLEQAMASHPEALEPRLLLGRFYFGMGRPEKVAPLFSSLTPAQKNLPEVLQLQALSQLSNKEHGEAQYSLEKLLESTPDTAPLRHLLAMAAAGSQDPERAEKELRRALELDQDFLPSRIALARIALAKEQTQAFDRHIRKLESLAPDDPEVLMLRALAASRAGEKTKAVTLAQQAFDTAPASTTLTALASYTEAAGQREEAMQLFRDWIEAHPDDVNASMAMANSLQLAKSTDDATVEYERLVKVDPDNIVALNNLAWHLREKDPARALEYARRANKLAPESGAVLDTLAVVEYSNKHYEQAQRSIERALHSSPGKPALLYHSAMIAGAKGDSKTAIKTLDKLLKSGVEFPEQEEAAALLAELAK